MKWTDQSFDEMSLILSPPFQVLAMVYLFTQKRSTNRIYRVANIQNKISIMMLLLLAILILRTSSPMLAFSHLLLSKLPRIKPLFGNNLFLINLVLISFSKQLIDRKESKDLQKRSIFQQNVKFNSSTLLYLTKRNARNITMSDQRVRSAKEVKT